MYTVKQSTALTVPVFVHDASGDAVTGLTDGSFTKRISKAGGAFAAMTVTLTELENGWYSLPISTAHSDTLAILSITLTNAGAKQVNLQFRVEAKLIDDLNDVAATDIVSAGAITTSGGAVSTVTTLTGHTAQTGDNFARLGAPAGASVSADIADVPTVSEFNARTLVAASYFDPATDTVALVTDVTTKTGYDLSATGLDLVSDTSTGAVAIAKAIWDTLLTGATFNIATSAGRRLRAIAGDVIREDTAQGPGTGTNQIVFDTGASAVDGTYDPAKVVLTGGTGIGQSRNILEYVGASKTATVDRDWKTLPDATSQFVIVADAGREHVNEGLAVAGGASTITLNALAQTADDEYIGQTVFIRSGTGADQTRVIIDYDGGTKVATVSTAWDVVPDTTSAYVMLPTSLMDTATVVAELFATQMTESYAADGVAPTMVQALFLIQQALTEFAIVSTALTVKKLDGSTTAAVMTLDDATNPTSTTRTT